MLTESMEDYLETIYRLAGENGSVRSVEIAAVLGVRAPSVTRMLRRLAGEGYVEHEKYRRRVSLTAAGLGYGRFLAWRDRALGDFLDLLGADADVKRQVEGIEHYITPATMSILRTLTAYFRSDPGALAEINRLRRQGSYPEGEELGALCAWSHKHAMN